MFCLKTLLSTHIRTVSTHIRTGCNDCMYIRHCQLSTYSQTVARHAAYKNRKFSGTNIILRSQLLCQKYVKNTCASSLLRRFYSDRPVVTNTMDEEELRHFQALAQSWWNETGEFEALHAMNKLRIPFIRDGLLNQRDDVSEDPSLPLQGLTIVDVGSGGGILSEPLARLGAFVVGLDPVEESTKIAQLHLEEDPRLLPNVKYITGSVEDLVATESESFDAVVASEVVEHVADYITFVEACCGLLKPGGSLFITTMNKTALSRSLAVFAAEKIFRVVPDGTHDWEKFVPPEDLKLLLDKNNLHTRLIHGMLYLPVFREWKWIQDTSINYALHAVKGEHGDTKGEHRET